jgi:phosphoribosylformylglycinamidine cyclo-ligase
VPPLFRLIQSEGNVDPSEMARVFNMGLGVVLFVAPEHVGLVERHAIDSRVVGRVVPWQDGERVTFGAGGP